MRFPIVLHTDDGIRFGVIVPDLPGCFSGGDTFDEALVSVEEAIHLHLEGLTEDGSDIPSPGKISEYLSNSDFAGGVWSFVDIDLARYDSRTKKINITLPQNLLDKIDRYVSSHGLTRSGFLAEAARRAMR